MPAQTARPCSPPASGPQGARVPTPGPGCRLSGKPQMAEPPLGIPRDRRGVATLLPLQRESLARASSSCAARHSRMAGRAEASLYLAHTASQYYRVGPGAGGRKGDACAAAASPGEKLRGAGGDGAGGMQARGQGSVFLLWEGGAPLDGTCPAAETPPGRPSHTLGAVRTLPPLPEQAPSHYTSGVPGRPSQRPAGMGF